MKNHGTVNIFLFYATLEISENKEERRNEKFDYR